MELANLAEYNLICTGMAGLTGYRAGVTAKYPLGYSFKKIPLNSQPL